MEFKGKVAVITGGASGIGKFTALALAARGTDIVIVDVNQTRLVETQKEIEALGRRALPIQCDVSKYDEVVKMSKQAIAFGGKVDILMNNAGVRLLGFADTLEPSDWDWILGINLYGVIYPCRAFLPHMIANGSGNIINTSSIGGLIAGQPNAIGYSTSKFAVTGFSEVLYKYLLPKNINVSLLCPGLVRTNLPENFRYVGNDRSVLGEMKEIPKAPGTLEPEDVAKMVIDAIERKRFLILTNPVAFQNMLERQAKDIQAFLETRMPGQ